jgi:hypothetical protein
VHPSARRENGFLTSWPFAKLKRRLPWTNVHGGRSNSFLDRL